MKHNILITFISAVFITLCCAVPMFSDPTNIHHLKSHMQILEFHAGLLDKDMDHLDMQIKKIYPEYLSVSTSFKKQYAQLRQTNMLLHDLEKKQSMLTEELAEILKVKRQITQQSYIHKKYNNAVPPFFMQSRPDRSYDDVNTKLSNQEKQTQSQLLSIRESIRQKSSNLHALKQNIAQARGLVQEKRNKYLQLKKTRTDLNLQKQDYLTEYNTMKASVEKHLHALPPTSGLLNKPVLIRPVIGDEEYINDDYGAFHAGGAILHSKIKEEVCSPADGKISFRGPLKQFGNVILIDHGNKWHTLIAGVHTSLVLGMMLKRGDNLGAVSDELQGKVYLELMKEGRTQKIQFQ